MELLQITAIQYKMLNKSKGPAMWSPRAQSDRMRFAECWRTMLEQTPNLDFYQEMVSGLAYCQDQNCWSYHIFGLQIMLKLLS